LAVKKPAKGKKAAKKDKDFPRPSVRLTDALHRADAGYFETGRSGTKPRNLQEWAALQGTPKRGDDL
jgi:hypothetical protein